MTDTISKAYHTVESLRQMAQTNIRDVNHEELVDINDVEIKKELSQRERMVDFISQIKNPYKAEILDEEEYSQLKEHYIAEKQRLEQELQKQRQRSLELEKRMRICDEQMERMRAILNQKEFDEELVHELIKKIYVGIDNSVEIEFKCSDPYQEVLALISEVQNE